MMTIQLQTLSKIEAMCSVTCVAGVQMDSLALLRPRVANQPVEQRSRKTVRCLSGKSRQVVNVENSSPSQELGKPKTCDALDQSHVSESKYLIRLFLLAADLRQKRAWLQVGTKCLKSRETRFNFGVRICHENLGSH